MKTEYQDKNGKIWITYTNYVDIETGEIIDKEEYKKNYKTTKNESTQRYRKDKATGRNYCYTTNYKIGRRKPEQLNLW